MHKVQLKRLYKSIEIKNNEMGLGRFELPTLQLSIVYSSQLSYRPGKIIPYENRTHIFAVKVQRPNH